MVTGCRCSAAGYGTWQSAAGYGNYQQWVANTQLEQRLSLGDYSVSNRGLRSGLVGTPERVLEQVAAFEAAGVDLLLLQCSPQYEEMERFSRQVIGPYRRDRERAARVSHANGAGLEGPPRVSV